MRGRLPLLFLSAAACGPLIQGEVDDAQICKTVPDSIAAAPPVPSSTQKWTSDYPLGNALPKGSDAGTASVDFVSLTLTLTSGVNSFDFVDSSQVTGGPDGGSGQTLLTYIRDPRGDAGPVLDLVPSSPIDVFPILQAGSLHLEGSVTGKLPPVAWSMDIRACFVAKYTFSGP